MITLNSAAFAESYTPQYYSKINNYSTGLFLAGRTTKIYSEPDEKSKIIDTISINDDYVNFSGKKANLYSVFSVFSTTKGIYFLTVTDEQDDWCKVSYENKSGWVKNTDFRYFIWKDFFFKYGKENGLYFFRDIPPEKKVIYSKPDDTSKKVASYSIVSQISLKFIRGNWALVSMCELGTESAFGWVKWRDADGNFILFPEI